MKNNKNINSDDKVYISMPDDNDITKDPKENRSLYKNLYIHKEGDLDVNQDKSSHSLKNLLQFAKPERSLMIIATISLTLASTFMLMIPAIVSVIIDVISDPNKPFNDYDPLTRFIGRNGFGKSADDILSTSGLLIALLSFTSAIFSFIRGWLFTLAGERVVKRIRNLLFTKLIANEIAFFDVTRSGELITRLATDTQILKDAITVNVSMFLRWTMSIIIGIGYLLLTSPKLTLIMLCSVPAVAITAATYGKKVRKLSKNIQTSLARASEVAEESITQIRTVRSYANEAYQSLLYSYKIDDTYKLGAKFSLYYGSFIGFISFIGTCCLGFVLWMGARMVLQSELSAGSLLSFVLYSLSIAGALGGLSGLYGSIMAAVGATQRVFELLDRQSLINIDGGQILSRNDFKSDIYLNHVSFAYPSRPEIQVLKDINIKIKLIVLQL